MTLMTRILLTALLQCLPKMPFVAARNRVDNFKWQKEANITNLHQKTV